MDNKTLTTKQHAAIEALLTCRTISDAAIMAKVGRRTLTTWLTDVPFCAELRKARSRVLDHAVRRLTALSGKAIDALDCGMDSLRPEVQVRAADIVLSRLLSLVELVELSERVAALETARDQP